MIAHSPAKIVSASLFTAGVLALGYTVFGFWTAAIFASGFLGGLLLWLFVPVKTSYGAIKGNFVMLALFLLHRVEERFTGFFERLAAITGTPTPDILSWQVVLLVRRSACGCSFLSS